jgi:circadian clock protein KaiC
VLANSEIGDRHRRGLYVLKSRGMAHSNELCEFVLTDHGLMLFDPPTPVDPVHANHGYRKRDSRHAVI